MLVTIAAIVVALWVACFVVAVALCRMAAQGDASGLAVVDPLGQLASELDARAA